MKKKKRSDSNVKTPTIIVRSQEQLGVAIRRLRKLQEVSQIDLAKKAGVTQATVSRIESGNQTAEFKTIILILAALNSDLSITRRPKSEPKNSLEGLF